MNRQEIIDGVLAEAIANYNAGIGQFLEGDDHQYFTPMSYGIDDEQFVIREIKTPIKLGASIIEYTHSVYVIRDGKAELDEKISCKTTPRPGLYRKSRIRAA